MNWMITETHNIPITLCGVFYSILCIFSIVTGLMYASGKKELNPLELSDEFIKRLSNKKKKKSFTKKMGWVTFIVGIIQGLTAIAIFKGYNVFLNLIAISFTIFSIGSVLFKLKGKINAFPIIKLIFYLIILIILLLAGTRNYSATKGINKYLKSTKNVKVIKIKEGYYFDGSATENAIIFFPGARVEYIAYSRLMYEFANNNYDCFLLSSPLNLAFFSMNKPSNIIKKYRYKKWYLGGHSLGGVVATMYTTQNPNNITGIISLASYPTKKIPNNIKYFSFYGSEDKVLNIKKYEESKKYLPDNYQIEIIKGGNHSGFANYGEQKGDGQAKISSDIQQKYVVSKMNE